MCKEAFDKLSNFLLYQHKDLSIWTPAPTYGDREGIKRRDLLSQPFHMKYKNVFIFLQLNENHRTNTLRKSCSSITKIIFNYI